MTHPQYSMKQIFCLGISMHDKILRIGMSVFIPHTGQLYLLAAIFRHGTQDLSNLIEIELFKMNTNAHVIEGTCFLFQVNPKYI